MYFEYSLNFVYQDIFLGEALGDFRIFPDILPVIIHVITKIFIFVNDDIDTALSFNISYPDIQ